VPTPPIKATAPGNLANVAAFLGAADRAALGHALAQPVPRLVTDTVISVAGLPILDLTAVEFDPTALYAPIPGNPLFLAAHVSLRYKRGWKLHVSAFPYHAEEIAEIVLPILCRLRIWHKYVKSSLLLSRMTSSDRGKFITIYTDDLTEDGSGPDIATIVMLLAPLLGRFVGPAIAETQFGHLLSGRLSNDFSKSGA
jgi:hypothetical protein